MRISASQPADSVRAARSTPLASSSNARASIKQLAGRRQHCLAAFDVERFTPSWRSSFRTA
jgi:hypothetical protein